MTPREIIREEAARLRAALPADGRLARSYERAKRARRDAIDDALIFIAHRIAGPTLDSYPTVEVGARYVLGASLAELAPELTRREAAAWMRQTEHVTPAAWLVAQVAARHDVALADSTPVAVARWVDGVMESTDRRAAIMRRRTARLGEVEVEGRLIDRIDELLPGDLCPSVQDTFAAATQRLARAAWDGPDELIDEEPWHRRLPAGVTVLRTATDLWEEGAECRHCVGVYAQRVYDRECIIVRVIAPDGTRSTAEVIDGRVTQHRAPANREPSPACRALVEACSWS